MLSITGWNRSPRFFLEHVSQREIRKAKSERTYHSASTPSSGEFDLVGRFLFNYILDVHGSFLWVRSWRDLECFRVEVIQLGKFSLRTNDIRSTEEVTRLRFDLTIDHVIIGLGISENGNTTNSVLLSFYHSNLEVDGVIFCLNLDRDRSKIKVTVVLVERCDVETFWVLVKACFKQCLIIDVAFLDLQDRIQLGRSVLGVSSEADIAEVELISFFQGDINGNTIWGSTVHAVLEDSCVSETLRIIARDQHLFIGIVRFLHELRALEDSPPTFLFRIL